MNYDPDMERRNIINSHSIQFSWKHVVAFLVLVFLIHELHEMSHVITVHFLCGCWSQRDFLEWNLCGSCTSQRDLAIAQVAGPVFNYLVMWTGLYWLLRSKLQWKRSLGFAMIFAALPLARIWGNADGGGDEIAAMRGLLDTSHLNKYVFRCLSFIVVLFFCGLPLLVCYLFIANKSRVLIFVSLALIPMFIDKWLVEGLLNHLANNPRLGMANLAGIPFIVIAWFLVLLALIAGFYRKLFSIAIVKEKEPIK